LKIRPQVGVSLAQLVAPDWAGDSEDAGEEAGELDKDVLVNIQGKEELQRFDLCTAPATHLHHKTYENTRRNVNKHLGRELYCSNHTVSTGINRR
jgi:hypothetical protein